MSFVNRNEIKKREFAIDKENNETLEQHTYIHSGKTKYRRED